MGTAGIDDFKKILEMIDPKGKEIFVNASIYHYNAIRTFLQ